MGLKQARCRRSGSPLRRVTGLLEEKGVLRGEDVEARV
jgi:hypothetical protein